MNISEWIKTVAAAVGGALAWLFGAWDPLIMVLVAVMVLDYITGVADAAVTGTLSSTVGFKGLL